MSSTSSLLPKPGYLMDLEPEFCDLKKYTATIINSLFIEVIHSYAASYMLWELPYFNIKDSIPFSTQYRPFTHEFSHLF